MKVRFPGNYIFLCINSQNSADLWSVRGFSPVNIGVSDSLKQRFFQRTSGPSLGYPQVPWGPGVGRGPRSPGERKGCL